MTAAEGASPGATVRGGSALAVAMGAMNVATYGFTITAAWMLGPASYGALVALMNTLLVLSVFQLGLQTTAARRIAADPDHVAQIEATILRVTTRAGLVLGALCLAAAPLIDLVLRLDSIPSAMVMAVAVVPLTMMGAQAGVLQGERRWRPLALLYAANGIPRLLIGIALMSWQPTVLAAMTAVAIAQFAPVLVGWVALRQPRGDSMASEGHRAHQLVREAISNSQTLLAFFALSSVDVVVARNVLSDHESGLYAAGLIMVKAVLFLPQFVVIIAFPAMSTPAQRRRALTGSIALVAALGALATVAAAALSGIALLFVGGREYAEIQDQLWLFAILGTTLSLLQLLVYSVLARRGQRSTYLVWLALLAVVALGMTTDSVEGLLSVVMAVDAVLVAVLLAVSLWLVRYPEPAGSAPSSRGAPDRP